MHVGITQAHANAAVVVQVYLCVRTCVCVYAPTDQSTVEDKEHFYSDLDGVVS